MSERRWSIALGLLAAAVVAVAVRSTGFPAIFGADGSVLLNPYDAAYHARRALYSFVHFPRVLTFDPYIAFPDGAVVPMPPLYDWALGGAARLLALPFGSPPRAFEVVAAWSSPVLAALTVLPVYAAGRLLAGSAAGMAAAWIFALLPASRFQSSLGYADHHAAVALVAACLLANSLVLVRLPAAASAVRAGLLHAAALAAMLLLWSGSLLYVAIAEGALLFASGVLAGDPRRLRVQAAGTLAAAGGVLPWIAAAPPPHGGAFTATTLSWLHPLALAAVAALCAGLAELWARRRSLDATERGLQVLALGLLGVGAAVVAMPSLGEALASGLGFLGKRDAWAATNPEQMPLLSRAFQASGRGPLDRFGFFALLVPAALVWMAWRLRREEDPAPLALLLCWTAPLLVLALSQVRYANDLAAPAALVSAVFVVRVVGARVRRRPALRLAVAALVVVGLLPALAVHARAFQNSVRLLERGPRPTRVESLYRFGAAVQRATPEPAGFLDASARPAYGVLVPPPLGHGFLWVARRPVSANNFGPYLDPVKYRRVLDFYAAENEPAALEAARALAARYAVTTATQEKADAALGRWLHAWDGSAPRTPEEERVRPRGEALAHFRLVTEGPLGGVAMKPFFQRPGGAPEVPYKLFEIVEGAVLETAADPGDLATATIALRTPLRERVEWRTEARADESGWVRLRLPYATEDLHDVHALGPYRVRAGGRTRSVRVPESAVRKGRTIRGGKPDSARAPNPAYLRAPRPPPACARIARACSWKRPSPSSRRRATAAASSFSPSTR